GDGLMPAGGLGHNDESLMLEQGRADPFSNKWMVIHQEHFYLECNRSVHPLISSRVSLLASGIRTTIWVPLPSRAWMEKVPPRKAALSRMFNRPMPDLLGRLTLSPAGCSPLPLS